MHTTRLYKASLPFHLKKHLLVSLSIFLLVSTLNAQSDNYWSWNFNTPSMLLAGSVVGGSAGPSAIFYNPSIINHDNTPSLSVSANITSLKSFQADNLAGNGIDASKLYFQVQPRFLSYVFPNKNEKIGMTAAILSPVAEETTYTIQHFDELDLISRTTGDEIYAGLLKYSRKYDDIYFGWGVSYEISEKFFIGMSSFVSVKLMKYDFRQNIQAYQDADSVYIEGQPEPSYTAINNFDESLKYWDLSLVFKFGALYKMLNNRLSFGLNVTMPNISVYREANVRKSFIQGNVYDYTTDQFIPNDIFVEIDEEARSGIKTPFSIAFGAQYYTKNMNNSISLTAEYFHSLESYAIFTPNNHPDNVPSAWENIIDYIDVMTYYTHANSVTNLGVGFKQFISPSLSVLGGFRTDFTNGQEDNIRFNQGKFKITQIHLDKYHITAGPILKIKQFFVISGLQYTFARNNDLLQIVNYSDPVEYNPVTRQSLQGTRQKNVDIRINEISFFLGLTVDL